MSASIVSSSDAIDAAFYGATRSTLVGSIIPADTRFVDDGPRFCVPDRGLTRGTYGVQFVVALDCRRAGRPRIKMVPQPFLS
jgi:hypothetical protein